MGSSILNGSGVRTNEDRELSVAAIFSSVRAAPAGPIPFIVLSPGCHIILPTAYHVLPSLSPQ